MSLYKQDPNNPNKQVPVGNNRVLIAQSTTPTSMIVQRRPDEVLIGTANATYTFLYETTSSVGANVGAPQLAKFITGSITSNAAQAFTLPIRPVAWRRSDLSDGTTGAIGDVTFIYKGGKYAQNSGPK